MITPRHHRNETARLTPCLILLVAGILLALLTGCSSGLASLPTASLPTGVEYTDLGEPDFSDVTDTNTSFEQYSPLDLLGRCGPATACVGIDLMPTEERERIDSIKPTGWHRIEYDFIDGGLLYNRCHLIAYSLTAENANEKNLITGTRQMNTAMIAFEKIVSDYVTRTHNHVLYRVTPTFEGAELVVRGVQIEALSVEDNGAAISFNVFIPNEQEGVGIDYLTGYSWVLEGGQASSSTTSQEGTEASYVLNTSSMRFHLPSCDSVPTIKAKNKATSDKSRDELIAEGYKPCGSCKP